MYFSPSLPDGEFRQYAVLPLSLFSVGDSSQSASAQSVQKVTVSNSESERGAKDVYSKLLDPIKGTLDALGARVSAVLIGLVVY